MPAKGATFSGFGMFSRRSFLAAEENELTELHRGAPPGWLDLSVSNPTTIGLSRPNYAAVLGAHEAAYEPAARGLGSARRALAELYRRRGVALEEEDLMLSASTSEAYGYLLMALCDPGDAIAIPEPSYPLFEHLARLHAVEVRRYRLAYDGAWYLDFDSLRAAVDQRTRAIFVVSPNNPTGSFLKPSELEQLWSFETPLVVDEVFRPYRWAGFQGEVAEPLADPPVLTFVLDGLSKRIGAPELKVGWMALAGPGKAEALRRLEWIADTFLSVSGPAQRALPELLAVGEDFQRALAARIERNWAELERATRDSAVTPLRAEGGWYAPIRLPAVLDERSWLFQLLHEERLSAHPGWLFDFQQQPVFVLSLILPEQVFARAVGQIVACAAKTCGAGR